MFIRSLFLGLLFLAPTLQAQTLNTPTLSNTSVTYEKSTGSLCAPGSMDSVCTGISQTSSCTDAPANRISLCPSGLAGKAIDTGTQNTCTNFFVTATQDITGCTSCTSGLTEDELKNIQFVLMSQYPAYNQYVLKKFAIRNGYASISAIPDGTQIDMEIKIPSSTGVVSLRSTPVGRSFREFIYMPQATLALPTLNRIKYLSGENLLPVLLDTSDPDFPIQLLPKKTDGTPITDSIPLYQAITDNLKASGSCDLVSTSACSVTCNVSTTSFIDNSCVAGELTYQTEACFSAWRYTAPAASTFSNQITAPWAAPGNYASTSWGLETENQWMGRPSTQGGSTYTCLSTLTPCTPRVLVSNPYLCKVYGPQVCTTDADGNVSCYTPCNQYDYYITEANQCLGTQRSFWATDDTTCAAFGLPPPQPVNGACGSANGQPTTSTPTNGACSSGNQLNLAFNGTTYTWQCSGKDGGSDASCSAPLMTPPKQPCPASVISWVDSANPANSCSGTVPQGDDNTSTAVYHTATNTSVGVANAICSNGTWSIDPFTFSTCTPYTPTTPSGPGTGTPTTPTNPTCTRTHTLIQSSPLNACYGAPPYGDLNTSSCLAQCTPCNDGAVGTGYDCTAYFNSTPSTPTQTAINGVCGSANGSSFTDDLNNPNKQFGPPESEKCAAGTPTPTTAPFNSFVWSCQGSNGGSTANCSAGKTGSPIATCGSAHYQTFSSAPTTGLCSTGSASAVSDNGSTYNWTCTITGNGLSAPAQCQATKQAPVSNPVVTAPSSNCVYTQPASPVAGDGVLCGTFRTISCNGQATTLWWNTVNDCTYLNSVPGALDAIWPPADQATGFNGSRDTPAGTVYFISIVDYNAFCASIGPNCTAN